jgi:xanthine dehydrogenase accessory factor
MEVAVTASALQLEHGGRVWYFCGSGCRTAFADAPDRYANA